MTTALKLVFTKNSPLNTTLVNDQSKAVMYEIETERSLFSKTTVIRKPFTSAFSFRLLAVTTYLVLAHSPPLDQRGEPVSHTSTEVAKIRWKRWSSDRIVYYGHDMKREEFMPSAGIFSE